MSWHYSYRGTPYYPHESGYYSDLTSSTKHSERRAFSANCSIISSVGECCSNCKKLHHSVQKCKKRKLESNGVASPFTNKRFLSKDEVEKQLQKERQARLTAEKRESIGGKSLRLSAWRWMMKTIQICLRCSIKLEVMYLNTWQACGNNSNNSCDAKVKRHIAGIRSKQCKLFTYKL